MWGLLTGLFRRATPPRVHLICYTRAGCCPCDQARTVLTRLAARGLVSVTYVEIDGDPVLADRFGARIPVVCRGDEVLAEGKVSEVRLARRLAALPAPGRGSLMRILHVVQRYLPYRGGSELVFAELSRRLAADGHAVTVYTTDVWDLEAFYRRGYRRLTEASAVIDGVPVVRWPVRPLPGGHLTFAILRRVMGHLSDLPVPGKIWLLERLGRFVPWTPGLTRRLTREEPIGSLDLVHACNVSFEGLMLAARDYARRAGVPLVVTPFVHLGEPHDDRLRRYHGMAHMMKAVREADAVIAMTDLERDFLVARGVAPDRISVTGAGVDPDSVRGGDGEGFRRRHGLGDRPLVASLGANAFDKGSIHLIEAARRLWAAGRDLGLVLAGPRLSHFDAYLAGVPAAERGNLRVLGPIDDAERRDLLAAATLFALPSRTDSFGIVYLEAWACGLPVIGARAGGVPGVIRDGVDGLLVSFGAVDELATAIARLLDDPAAARAMGAAGAATLSARGWPVIHARVREIYERAVAARPRQMAPPPGSRRGRRGGSWQVARD